MIPISIRSISSSDGTIDPLIGSTIASAVAGMEIWFSQCSLSLSGAVSRQQVQMGLLHTTSLPAATFFRRCLQHASARAYSGSAKGASLADALSPSVYSAVRAISKQLRDAGLPYAIAGAVASCAHGHQRNTRDVDVLVNREHLNAVARAIEGRGWLPRYPGARKSWVDKSSGSTPVPIDILVSGDFPGDGLEKPVAFPHVGEGGEDVVPVQVEGDIAVLPLVQLIELKLASGMTAAHRGKDMNDVQALIAANDLPREFVVELHPYVRKAFVTVWDTYHNAQKEGML